MRAVLHKQIVGWGDQSAEAWKMVRACVRMSSRISMVLGGVQYDQVYMYDVAGRLTAVTVVKGNIRLPRAVDSTANDRTERAVRIPESAVGQSGIANVERLSVGRVAPGTRQQPRHSGRIAFDPHLGPHFQCPARIRGNDRDEQVNIVAV